MHLRLCLVAVKRFSENTYFPEMLISRKGKCFHVFGCILKNFPENIFWCLVFGKEEGKHKSENTSHNPKKKNHQWRPRRDRDLGSRSRLGLELELGLELAISDWSWSSRLGLDLLLSRARALSLSLSLSHFPEMLWRENRSVKSFPWSKAVFLGQWISISRK